MIADIPNGIMGRKSFAWAAERERWRWTVERNSLMSSSLRAISLGIRANSLSSFCLLRVYTDYRKSQVFSSGVALRDNSD